MAGSRRREYDSAQSVCASGDDCTIEFTVDLVSVDMSQVSRISVGRILPVKIIRVKGYQAIGPVMPDGDLLGSIAAIPSLAQLKSCIELGRKYDAFIEKIDGSIVTVHVELER